MHKSWASQSQRLRLAGCMGGIGRNLRTLNRPIAKYLVFASLLAASTVPLAGTTPALAASYTPCSDFGIGPAPGQAYTIGVDYPFSFSTTYTGVEGNITVPNTSPSFSMVDQNFSDEAVWILASSTNSQADGLEIGWGMGYLAYAGIYQLSPALYATFNGPGSIAGPSVPLNSDYQYVAYTNGSGQAVFVVRSGGSDIWKETPTYPNSSYGGMATGGGEIYSGSGAVIPMGPSTVSNLRNLATNGVWSNWSGISGCTTDSTYMYTINGPNSVSNSGG